MSEIIIFSFCIVMVFALRSSVFKTKIFKLIVENEVRFFHYIIIISNTINYKNPYLNMLINNNINSNSSYEIQLKKIRLFSLISNN